MAGKPTLGVSGWRLHGQRTGIGRYVLNLIEHWTPDLVAERFAGITVYSPREFAGEQPAFPSGVNHKVLGPPMQMIVWDNLRLAPFARDSVMLYPSYSRPLVARGATVVAIHDATMRLHPELFTRSDKLMYDPLYGWSARASTLVITTTEAAKADIAREWNVDPEKIRVTSLAAAECFRPLPVSIDRTALRARLTGGNEPFFLFVGKVTGRRNLIRFLEAFALFRTTTGFSHRLVIVGPPYAIDTVDTRANELGIRPHVLTKRFVGDEELNELYNCADAFVMPSAYETISLPVMEAQAAGAPVICVDTPGSREITGGEALLIPRLEVQELVQAMIRLASDTDMRSRLRDRGLQSAAAFSWQRCATLTLDVCAEAARLHAGGVA